MALLIVGNLMSVNYTISGGGTTMTFNDGVTEILQADVLTYGARLSLTTVVIPTSVMTICGTFINQGLAIDDGAFSLLPNLTTITINTPSSLQVIGIAAFYGDSGITSFTLPSGLEYIGDYAFNVTSGTPTISTIPSSVTYIGVSAFRGSIIFTNLTTLPPAITQISESAFSFAFFSIILTIPSTVITIGVASFNSATFNGGSGTDCGLVLVQGLETISNGAFQGAIFSGNLSLTIPPSTISIGDYAFFSSNLTNITYTSTTTVGTDSFPSGATITILPGPNPDPDPPTDLSGTWNPSSIDLLWTAPLETGSAPIAYYLITDTSSSTVYQTPDSSTNYTIVGTDPRITYTYTLKTVNQDDASSVQSIPITVEPPKPDPPTDLSGTWNPSSIDLLWTAPTETGSFPIAYYLITDTDNTTVYQTPDNNTNYTITGTGPNIIYNYTIQTVNQNDISSVSSASLRVEPPLNPPRDISIIPTYNTLTLNWTAPIETGSHPITNYIIINTSTLDSVTLPYTTTSYTFTGLTDDILYTYVLRTVTDFGISADSDNVSGRLIPLPPELLDCSPALALNAISKGGNFASAITTALGKQMNNTTIAAKVFAQTQATVCCSTTPFISPFVGGTTSGTQTLALMQQQALCTYNQNLAVAKLRQIPGCPIDNSQRFAKYQRFPSAEANCMPPVIITGLPKALNGPCTNVIGISQTRPPS